MGDTINGTRVEGIVLDVPATPRSLRLLRLAAADSAADAGLDLDGVESARIAVDELASLLLAAEGGDRLVVRFNREPGRLWVEGERSSDGNPPSIDPIVEELLSVCVTDWHLDGSESGRVAFRFEQRSAG